MTMEKVPMTIEGFRSSRPSCTASSPKSVPASSSRSRMRASTATCPRTPSTTPPRRQQGLNEARVADIEDKHRRAEVIDTSKLSGTTVKFGATVTLEDEDSGEKVKYKIVGDSEANVRDGKISISSPIARALIGKSKGDTAEVTTPKGARSYEILKIEFK